MSGRDLSAPMSLVDDESGATRRWPVGGWKIKGGAARGISTFCAMIYQHPLAYLLALEGLALMRSWAGDFDEEFVLARLAEVRQLLANDELAYHPGVKVRWGDVRSGYRDWAATYDEPSNGLFSLDTPVVGEILDGLGDGRGRMALDAACGTGGCRCC